MSYLILVGCGSMGSPNPVKLNKLECGIQNACSISYSDAFVAKMADKDASRREL
jgi:hypothetical protein